MSPDLRFNGQPFSDPNALGSLLRSAIADSDARHFTVAIAWARFGGLIRLANALDEFRGRGGRAVLIVGIDEGIASRPGLALALSLFDTVSVLHDRGGRTFHPKIYLVEGEARARLFVGSSNLTAAGLYFNFEASLEAEFALPAEAGHDALVGARSYLSALERDTATRQLDDHLLDLLASDDRYGIAPTEQRDRNASSSPAIDPTEMEAANQDDERFGLSSNAKTFPPPLSQEDRVRLRQLEAASGPAPRIAGAIGRSPDKPILSWSKELRSTDAQHPPKASSSPTGNLRLSKAGQPIDHRTWFRYQFFGDLEWARDSDLRGNLLETAAVPISVLVKGVALGVLEMRIDHAPHREAGQNNVPTVLHWGPVMGSILRAEPYMGSTVILDRLKSGAFRLMII